MFHSTTKNHAAGITVLEQRGTGLVELIEQGKLQSHELYTLLEGYILPMLEKGMDYLVLGCTHYPYLIPILKKMLPENVTIIDSGQAVARQTKSVLERLDLLSNSSEWGSHQFFTNKNEKVLSNVLPSSKLNLTVSFKDF